MARQKQIIVADPLLGDLENPEKYHVERNVPVFRPHKRYERLEDGSFSDVVKYEVTEDDLPEIAANSNKDAESFHYHRQTIGHVVPGLAQETAQPAKLIGVGKNYRVGSYPNGEKVIVADLYTQIQHKDEAGRFPYRSAEYKFKEKKIRGIARLLQDPALELGTYMYRDTETISYAEAMMATEEKDKGGYAAKEETGAANGSNDLTGRPGGDGKQDAERKPVPPLSQITAVFGDLNPDEVVAADRVMKYFAAKYPQLAPLLAEAQGEVPDQKPQVPDNSQHRADEEAKEEAGKMLRDSGVPEESAPGGPGNAKPGDQQSKNNSPKSGAMDKTGQKAKTKPAPTAKEKDMSVNAEAELLAAANKRIAELEVSALLDQLEKSEHYQFDRADALQSMIPMDETARKAKMDSIRKYSRKSPGGDKIEVLQDAPATTETASDTISLSGNKMTIEEYVQAWAHAEQGQKPDEDLAKTWERGVFAVTAKRAAR